MDQKLFDEMFHAGTVEKFKNLIAQGGDVKACFSDGLTLLMNHSYSNRSDIVDFLISEGADVNAKTIYGVTALMYAAGYDSVDAINSLTKAGADPDMKNNDGKTALMIAAENYCFDAIYSLTKAGADVCLKDNEGNTAYDYAKDDKMREFLKNIGLKQRQEKNKKIARLIGTIKGSKCSQM